MTVPASVPLYSLKDALSPVCGATTRKAKRPLLRYRLKNQSVSGATHALKYARRMPWTVKIHFLLIEAGAPFARPVWRIVRPVPCPWLAKP